MELTAKGAVVTGAANGIGKAAATEFHKQGAKVVLADRDAELLEKTVAQLNSVRPNSAFGVACDLSTEAANADLVARSKKVLGFVDLFFANAGVAMGTDLSTPEETWNISFDVNVHAHRWAVKYLIDDWLTAKSGYFVSTASAAGLLTAIGSAPYSLTKHAALAFAEWLSITYGNRGLKVSCLCPQGVNTNMLRRSDEATAADNGNVVRASGAVLEPEYVAECVVEAVRQETFLILPHPEVGQFVNKKAAEHERWLAGMRKLQLRTLGV
ncbi:MAG: SDR family oxidoreductase [Actinobacteria bacterium]|nr:SDR family oxidoreductase [Actinomycetota bacterium]